VLGHRRVSLDISAVPEEEFVPVLTVVAVLAPGPRPKTLTVSASITRSRQSLSRPNVRILKVNLGAGCRQDELLHAAAKSISTRSCAYSSTERGVCAG
jgi:hypothetical protein